MTARFCKSLFKLLLLSLLIASCDSMSPEIRESKIYWIDSELGKIRRANLDGSRIEDLVTNQRGLYALALDGSTGKMYWNDANQIWRANLDGSKVEVLVSNIRQLEAIVLDTANGKIYWTDLGGQDPGKFQRANLDGSDVEDLITNLRPRHVTLDIANGKTYWGTATDRGFDEIQRANLDGSEVEVLVTDPLLPTSLALASGKIYWTAGRSVRRANLDGSEAEVLITNLRSGPRHITLDVDGGKMYWFVSWFISEFSIEIAGKIQRANLDGSNVEDLVVNLEVPGSIALDVVNDKMYWTYFSNSSPPTGKFQQANLNGSEIKDLVPDSQAPHSLSLFLVD